MKLMEFLQSRSTTCLFFGIAIETICIIFLIIVLLLLLKNNKRNRKPSQILKKMQEVFLLEGERYKIATELSQDVIFEYRIPEDEMINTKKYKDLFGGELFISDYFKECEKRRDIVHPDDWGIFLEYCQALNKGKNIIEVEFRLKNRLGEFIWCQVMGKTIYDENKKPLRVIGKIVNIDIHKKQLEALEYKATRDPLTNVYNREITIKKIDKFISGNRTGKHMLMFIDFDDFKKVNDNYGHLIGDKILVYVIGKIKEVFSEGEIIGRTGGDEFIVFAGNITDIDEVLEKAALLRNAMETTYCDNGYEIPISGSIGIAMYPEDGNHFEQLMEKADHALYLAKEFGKNNYVMYSQFT
ncbi:MAG: sensor domain-containing diguanylate cyclase [Clostridiales bacterium]|nr:sensor domain-containing diguanylate cyclase [Clostridiales bacterium]